VSRAWLRARGGASLANQSAAQGAHPLLSFHQMFQQKNTHSRHMELISLDCSTRAALLISFTQFTEINIKAIPAVCEGSFIQQQQQTVLSLIHHH